MRLRPWPLVVLAGLHLVAPFMNGVLSAWLMDVSISTYYSKLLQASTPLQLLEFFGLLPIAGYAIYKMKLWSYPVFFLVMARTLMVNTLTWTEYPQLVSSGVFFTLVIANLGLVSYFLIPAVRRAYFDRKIRWWENQKRFRFEADVQIQGSFSPENARTENISEGGMYLKSSRLLALEELIHFRMSIFGRDFEGTGRIVYRQLGRENGYGIQFQLPRAEQKRYRKFTRALALIDVSPVTPALNQWQEFQNWCMKAYRTWKAWVPEFYEPSPVVPAIQLVSSKPDRVTDTKDEAAEVSKAA